MDNINSAEPVSMETTAPVLPSVDASAPPGDPSRMDITLRPIETVAEAEPVQGFQATEECRGLRQQIGVQGVHAFLTDQNGKCFAPVLRRLLTSLPKIERADQLFGDQSDDSMRQISDFLLQQVDHEADFLSERNRVEILQRIQKKWGMDKSDVAGESLDTQFTQSLNELQTYFQQQNATNRNDLARSAENVVQKFVLDVMMHKFYEIMLSSPELKEVNIASFFRFFGLLFNLQFNVNQEAKGELERSLDAGKLCTAKRNITMPPLTIPQIFLPMFFRPEFPKTKMLLWMGPGTGKTCAAIAGLDQFIEQDWTIFWVLPPKNVEKMKQQLKSDMFRLGCLRVFVDDMRQVEEESTSGQQNVENEEEIQAAAEELRPRDVFFKSVPPTADEVDVAKEVMRAMYDESVAEGDVLSQTADWDALSTNFFKYYGQEWVNSNVLASIYGEEAFHLLSGKVSRVQGQVNRKRVCRPTFDLTAEQEGGCIDFGDVVLMTCPQFARLMTGVEDTSRMTNEERMQVAIWRRLRSSKFRNTLFVLDEAHHWFHEGSMESDLHASAASSEKLRVRTLQAMDRVSRTSREYFFGKNALVLNQPCKFMLLTATPVADDSMAGFGTMLSFLQEPDASTSGQAVAFTPRTMKLLKRRVFDAGRSFVPAQEFVEEQELARLCMLQICYVSANDSRWFGGAMPKKELIEVVDVDMPQVQRADAAKCILDKQKASRIPCLKAVDTGANQIIDAKSEKRFTFLNPGLTEARADTNKLFNDWLQHYGLKFKAVLEKVVSLTKTDPQKKHVIYVEGDLNALLLAGAMLAPKRPADLDAEFPYIPLKHRVDPESGSFFYLDKQRSQFTRPYFGLVGVGLPTLQKYGADRLREPWVTASSNAVEAGAKFTPRMWQKYQSDVISMFNDEGNRFHTIIITDKMREGVSFFKVGYVHMVTVPQSEAAFIQAVGRATRLCGNKDIGNADVRVIVYRSKLDKLPGDNPYTITDEIRLQSEGRRPQAEGWKQQLEDGVAKSTCLNIMKWYIEAANPDNAAQLQQVAGEDEAQFQDQVQQVAGEDEAQFQDQVQKAVY